MMFFDVINHGKIIDSIAVPIGTDVAILTHKIAEELLIDVKNIHLCNLRFLSQGMSALLQ